MFSSLGLFKKTRCPDIQNCKRPSCIFSHSPDAPAGPAALNIPIHVPKPQPQPRKDQTKPTPSTSSPTVPSKRAASELQTTYGTTTLEPPRKISKLGPTQHPGARPISAQTSSGVPVLKVLPAHSLVPIPVRQAMLKSLYDHFVILYRKVLPTNPTIASEHSLKQEQEVYDKSNKLTYRNAVISSIASLKRRDVPQSVGDPTVGTEGDLAARREAKTALQSLQLTTSHLETYILSEEEMITWGYVVAIPEGPGGDKPSEEGGVMKCERCKQPKQVRRMEEAEECVYHWGRLFTKKVSGEKVRQYTCCSALSTSEDGCVRGPHVFYEFDPVDLHKRHAFTHTRPPDTSQRNKILEVAALDCEMIYTTGGMRVARVSVVDGDGKEVFDKYVKMDEGVHVIDFNTRFSGITQEIYSTLALQPLVDIRRSLDELIGPETILIGHALENDLKTLRMIHLRNVDTAITFRHPAGPPFRRALRDLVKEYLGRAIQTGGANVGHSSVEDSIATLDLVKWHVINKPAPPPMRTPKPPPLTIASTSETPTPTPSSTAAASTPAASTVTSTPVATPASTQMSSTTSASQEEPKPPPTADDIPF